MSDAGHDLARRCGAAGAAFLALGIAIGAFGAHALKPHLTVEHYATLQTGVHYQLVNALGMLVLGTWARASAQGAALAWPARLVSTGTLVFCLTLYALALDAPRWLGAITPVGGVAMIAGWALAARALWRQG